MQCASTYVYICASEKNRDYRRLKPGARTAIDARCCRRQFCVFSVCRPGLASYAWARHCLTVSSTVNGRVLCAATVPSLRKCYTTATAWKKENNSNSNGNSNGPDKIDDAIPVSVPIRFLRHNGPGDSRAGSSSSQTKTTLHHQDGRTICAGGRAT
ncbi:hypothetical protein BT67DRAFT_442168 [Trichocladium antarcticum]|uniref:Uncharacterized protein n=1 Tax=Trichocladium antarcticum TaxID=1450529 RepID=A0AAN6ZDF8_9PEZI|nr:hypothetical protein BT67DRAFT_442168 [Trichocladium antarcticum]